MIVESNAQTGSMATLQKTPTTYAVSIIPGAAQKYSPYHYYPPSINVPVGTTIGWFNNDFGQPCTVTSGVTNASDAGSIFNSGVLPATTNAFFQYTFDNPGDYVYHCIIRPWRQAIVSVSDSYERGHYFEMSSGVGQVFNLTKDFRTLLDFQPLTIPLDSATPLVYNITMIKNSNDTVFSNTFVTDGESLPLELIKSNADETTTYGPDFSSTGAYHMDAPFLSGNAEYIIAVELSSINSQVPEFMIKDEFSFKTVT
ncbi:cupredoxin domain-containing protein [Candidatus Nitrosocosmicus sp. T]